MRLHRVGPVEQAHIGWQIFAKIGHPTRQSEIEHFLADDAVCEPVCGVGIGEIHNACVKFAEVDGIGCVTVLPQCEIIFGQRLLIQRTIHRQIGVHIAQKANATFGEHGYLCRQVGIACGIPFPVPEQALSKTCLTDANPILAPQPRNGRARGSYSIQAVKCVCAVLKADNCPRNRPIGQGRLTPETVGQLCHQIGQRWRVE